MRSISLTLALIPALTAGAALAQAAQPAQPEAAPPAPAVAEAPAPTLTEAPVRLTDSQFVKASRCLGMTRDTARRADMETKVRAEQAGRSDLIKLKAQKARDEARKASDFADARGRARYETRYQNECAPLLDPAKATQMAAAAEPNTQAAPTAETAEAAAAKAKPSRMAKMASGVRGAFGKMAFWKKDDKTS